MQGEGILGVSWTSRRTFKTSLHGCGFLSAAADVSAWGQPFLRKANSTLDTVSHRLRLHACAAPCCRSSTARATSPTPRSSSRPCTGYCAAQGPARTARAVRAAARAIPPAPAAGNALSAIAVPADAPWACMDSSDASLLPRMPQGGEYPACYETPR